MQDDHVYNLMSQLVTEHRSLYRIKEMYIKDSGPCAECKKMWQALAKDKEEHIQELELLLRTHMS